MDVYGELIMGFRVVVPAVSRFCTACLYDQTVQSSASQSSRMPPHAGFHPEGMLLNRTISMLRLLVLLLWFLIEHCDYF